MSETFGREKIVTSGAKDPFYQYSYKQLVRGG